jgi:RimJ/RimL family protein N-acetyltransferase
MEGGGLRHRPVTIVPSVTTSRLHGSRLHSDDFDLLCALHRDPTVMATLGGVRSDERTREYLAENLAHWDQHGYGLWIFRDRASGAFIGRGGLRHATIEDAPEIEVTYALTQAAWGQGFATEIATASLEVGFRDLSMTNIVAFAEPGNHASRRVMEKVGLTYERDIVWHGVDCVLYRIHS